VLFSRSWPEGSREETRVTCQRPTVLKKDSQTARARSAEDVRGRGVRKKRRKLSTPEKETFSSDQHGGKRKPIKEKRKNGEFALLKRKRQGPRTGPHKTPLEGEKSNQKTPQPPPKKKRSSRRRKGREGEKSSQQQLRFEERGGRRRLRVVR